MTEKEKMLLGMIYDANNDSALIAERMACKELCRNYNDLRPKDMKGRESLLHKIFGSIKGGILIEQPFYCDYGYNIVVGKNFYANFNLVIGHPVDAVERRKGLEYAKPITVGNDVWIGAGVSVLPGVTIGDNCVIGAGSVVSKDIPSNSVAVGNPCKVIKSITPIQ